MAKSILFSTKTSNFEKLIGNGEIYSVPPYQRDYSWEEEQWDNLWQDICELIDRPEQHHYMGSLVLLTKETRESTVIDGQQRLVTLSLLALAIIKEIQNLADNDIEKKNNITRAGILRQKYIGEKNPESLKEFSKLTLNLMDDEFYQRYSVQLSKPAFNLKQTLPKSQRRILECSEFFEDKIKYFKKDYTGDRGVLINNILFQTIAQQLLFIIITVDDEMDAYTVFETLNARGLELTSTDLLKNFLFSRINSIDIPIMQKHWKSIIDKTQQERFPEFLRFHLLCQKPDVRKNKLFKVVKEEILNISNFNIFSYLEKLEARAVLYQAFNDSNHELWIGKEEIRASLKELELFKVKQMMPLLFAAYEKFSQEYFTKVLKYIVVIFFRHAIIGNQNPNKVESVYHKAAKAVLSEEVKKPRAVFNILKEIYVSDQIFINDFANKSFDTSSARKKIVKYILCKLENELSSINIDYETTNATIEHILPENPSQEWEKEFPSKMRIDYIYRIGNFTLLAQNANKELGSKSFGFKREIYAKSDCNLTKKIAEDYSDEWTVAILEKRQKDMALLAAKIWSVNLDD